MVKRFQKAALIALFTAMSSMSMSAPTTNASNELVLEAPVVKDAPAASSIAPSVIRRIEKLVRLPPGAKPFAKYERYYTKVVVGGRDMISAEFIVPYWVDDNMPTAHVVNSENDFPLYTDAGCYVIWFSYDIKRKRISNLSCESR
jgi:hypothetical protein